MQRIGLFVFILVLGALALGSGLAYAQKSEGSVLFVAPNRLIIPPNEKVAVLTVSNKSNAPRRYDVTVVDQVMDTTGVTQRKDTFEYSAKRMVKFVPKRFTLQPDEQQTVRVIIMRPAGLGDGDYHSHLLFREVPLNVKDKAQLAAERKDAEKTVSFEIRTLYGIGVPVIIQTGTVVEDMTMGDPAIGRSQDGKNRWLTIGFDRIGNSEAAGKLSAEYVQNGKPGVPVIEPQWVRLYREVEKISKNFPLIDLPADAQGGKIVVTLVKDETDESKTVRKEIPFQ